jgi:protein involved in polysaccharide export with SLBB domain
MEPSHAASLSAAGSACARRQIRRDRQARRAIWAMLGLMIVSVLLAKLIARVVADAEADEREQLAAISAALPQSVAPDGPYIIEPPDILLVEVAAEAAEDVAGEHLVAPDGTINLGAYGLAHVAGLTVTEAKRAIENQLKDRIRAPRVSVDVLAFNSKVYYVIIEGHRSGDSLIRVPFTGNETVLDALAQINGLARLSEKNIWIERSAPGGVNCQPFLPVDWKAITASRSATNNYALLPGDRVFVAANKIISLDTLIDHISGPMEWLLGYSPLSSACGR